MAITFKNSDPEKGWQTAALFGVDPAMIKKAKATGKIQIDTIKLGVYRVKTEHSVFGTIPITPTALSLAQAKAMGPASLQQYRVHFETALKAALAHVETMAPAKAAPIPFGDEEDDGLDVTAAVKPAFTKTAAFSPAKAVPKPAMAKPEWPSKTAPIKLHQATELYQPVMGTNATSVYYTFALFPGLKLAAKITGTKLSVRAEGSKLDEYSNLLKQNFKMDQSVGYSSGHYIVDEGASLMVKALAAIVGVLGFEKIEKVADLNKFVKDQA